jgi:uroporphyrinogen III methyltransferase / synthase
VPADDMRSERLAELLVDRCRGKRVLLARAPQARQLLLDEIAAVASVDAISVYEQVVVVDPSNEVFNRLRQGETYVVALTSPNIARAFLGACDETIRQALRSGRIVILANSERLARELKQQGIPAVVSPEPTMAGLIAGLIRIRGLLHCANAP